MADELAEEHLAGLHELRLRGVLLVSKRPGLSDALEAAGLAARRGDKLVPTPAGREVHAGWARLEPASEAAAVAERAYATFLPFNRELLRLCHDWQMRAGVENAHDDPNYDWAVIDRLGDLDERIGPVVRRLGRSVARFEPYRARLRDARRRVEASEHDWFASPRCDSYHTVWMLLHEDLLCATGSARRDEPPVE